MSRGSLRYLELIAKIQQVIPIELVLVFRRVNWAWEGTYFIRQC